MGYSLSVVALRAVQRNPAGSLPPDEALVDAALRGEPWAAEALFRRHARRINGLAMRLIGRDADVDDLVQDTFASAFSSLGTLQDPRAFGSWVAAILVRTTNKLIRKRRLLRRLGLGRGSLAIDLDSLTGPTVPQDHAIELRRVYALAQELPAQLRIPLLLRRVEGMPLAEIAELCGASLATIKRRVEQGEEFLRTAYLRGDKS